MINYRQIYAKKREYENRVKSLCPDISNKSGIYLFYRTNENFENCVYIGQAKDLLNRTASHLEGYKKKNPSHIDKSLFKHKFYPNNNFGWRLKVLCTCPVVLLDSLEQDYIQYYLNNGYKVYNVTGGGQIDKAKDIGERQQTKLKSYKNGKGLGYEKARKEVKTYFDKYLDYTIKGKPTKIKERKLKEFKEFLGGTDNEIK